MNLHPLEHFENLIQRILHIRERQHLEVLNLSICLSLSLYIYVYIYRYIYYVYIYISKIIQNP
jgi:hypothetical protein